MFFFPLSNPSSHSQQHICTSSLTYHSTDTYEEIVQLNYLLLMPIPKYILLATHSIWIRSIFDCICEWARNFPNSPSNKTIREHHLSIPALQCHQTKLKICFQLNCVMLLYWPCFYRTLKSDWKIAKKMKRKMLNDWMDFIWNCNVTDIGKGES